MIDAHVHLITAGMIGDVSSLFEKTYPGFGKTVMDNAAHLINRQFLDFLSNTSLKEFAERWLSDMDKNGIEKAVFFPISERPIELKEFLDFAPERLKGYAYLNNPLSSDAPARIRNYIKDYGFKGLKLYPCLQLFHASDERLFPLYEEAQNLEIPITFHMGITHAPVSDYRYTNPLDLQLPLKLFPKLNFIVAHFGAGFFREVCLLSFHNTNLYLDTSGTNNWLDYTPEKIELKEVFKRALEIFGPERILFGTDSVMRPDAGYRSAIMNAQRKIIKSVCRDESCAQRIMRDNALELLG